MDRQTREHLLEEAARDPELQRELLERCRKDIVFWLNTFCWTYDPRQETTHMPFLLYPFQEQLAREVLRAIEEQKDLGIEKSRDMGVSWLMMLIFQYGWLFRDGWNIHVGSRKASEVDRGYVDPAETLFGKFRYNLERLPGWMQPEKWQSRLMCIENHDNGNFLTGEAATPSFSRGARKKVVGFDEFAFWDCADAAYASASQTTNCRIVWSTPYGETNKFAKLMNNPDNEIIPLDGESPQ